MKVLIAGDYSPKDRVRQLIVDGKAEGVLSSVKDVINGVDYAIVNFESVVTTGKEKLIKKAGPGMYCPSESVGLLKEAGFSAVTLANNHIRDYGDDGVRNTIAALKNAALDYVGGGLDINEADAVLYKQVKGKTLAVINVCEHEFSIATEKQCGAAALDVVKESRKIRIAHSMAEYVIVIIHGGNEHYQLPSPRMKSLYRFFIEMGADAVVNHHQHCYSGYEVYQGKPIFYGLGNFCFDWNGRRGSIWNEGYMVSLTLDSTIGFELIPYIQCDEEPRVVLLNEAQSTNFFDNIGKLNNIISNDKILEEEYEAFCRKRKHSIICPFTPYLNSYVRIAAGRHYLPYLIPKQKLCGQINFIECESHRDVLLKVLHEELEK